jgi:hypothetical protein
MTITAKVYLNQTSRFASFNAFKAELLLAVEFEIDATVPEFLFDAEAFKDLDNDEFDAVYRAARAKHAEWVYPILNRIYEQLNVGGDIVPAEAYTVDYRMAGHRSLSVGDLVTLEWDHVSPIKKIGGGDLVLHDTEAYSVESAGFNRRPAMVVRRGLQNFAKNEGSLDHFLPVARTDIEVDAEGKFQLKAPVFAPSTSFEFVQEDLRGGL